MTPENVCTAEIVLSGSMFIAAKHNVDLADLMNMNLKDSYEEKVLHWASAAPY